MRWANRQHKNKLITLSLYRPSPVKRQRFSDWLKKKDPSIGSLIWIHFKHKDTNRLKVRKWKKI